MIAPLNAYSVNSAGLPRIRNCDKSITVKQQKIENLPNLYGNDYSKYFHVKSVTYSEEITKMIDEELIVKTKEDYIHESRNEIISID